MITRDDWGERKPCFTGRTSSCFFLVVSSHAMSSNLKLKYSDRIYWYFFSSKFHWDDELLSLRARRSRTVLRFSSSRQSKSLRLDACVGLELLLSYCHCQERCEFEFGLFLPIREHKWKYFHFLAAVDPTKEANVSGETKRYKAFFLWNCWRHTASKHWSNSCTYLSSNCTI